MLESSCRPWLHSGVVLYPKSWSKWLASSHQSSNTWMFRWKLCCLMSNLWTQTPLVRGDDLLLLPTCTSPTQCADRYDDLIQVFGRSFVERLGNLNIFMVCWPLRCRPSDIILCAGRLWCIGLWIYQELCVEWRVLWTWRWFALPCRCALLLQLCVIVQ